MSFQWLEYLALAHELNGKSMETVAPEARWRAAISRAYYATYNYARLYALASDKSVTFPKHADAHALVAAWFTNQPDTTKQLVGWDLGTLRSMRNQADYNDSVNRPDKVAAYALELAEGIISKVNAPVAPPAINGSASAPDSGGTSQPPI